jgi:hypothetical protein
MNYKKKKTINIFSDGSFSIVKSSFSKRLTFLEKDDCNSILWLKFNSVKSSINKAEYRKKFLK